MKCFAEKRFFKWTKDEVSVSLRNRSGSYGGGSEVFVTEAYCVGNGQLDQAKLSEKVGALNCMHDQQIILRGGDEMTDNKSTVRRLTPMECERLQGFPDGWTDIGEWTDSKGKKRDTSDTARYKALGNSIALPYWKVLARRIAAQYDRDITMGSLFDGIGGFPLAFQHCGATPVWASEIEEFCIAVTKKHFPEGDDNDT